MNAMVTLALLFAGAQIWGLAGMILFIPMGAVVKVVCEEVESLAPVGFLMGRMPSHPTKEKGPLARRVAQLSDKIEKRISTRAQAEAGRRPAGMKSGEIQTASARVLPGTDGKGPLVGPEDGPGSVKHDRTGTTGNGGTGHADRAGS